MEAAKKSGLVFGKEKCKIASPEIECFGMTWSRNGVKSSVEKCDSIRNRPPPTNVKELQSFLGLLQYLAPFLPHLTEKTHLLRTLTRKGVDGTWTAEHQRAYEELKNAITDDMHLQYFNTTKPAEIEVDASTKGLVAALIQEGKPVSFASKALTPTETRYANIERELLSVVYALKKFHTYIYCKAVAVYSDHKPLEHMYTKKTTVRDTFQTAEDAAPDLTI